MIAEAKLVLIKTLICTAAVPIIAGPKQTQNLAHAGIAGYSISG